MKTKIYNIIDENDEKLIEVAQILKDGGTVAFPTETVYGVGANAMSEAAVDQIYEAKGRPSDNPLIVHISELNQLDGLVELAPLSQELMDAFWPGAITLIFKSKGTVVKRVTPGLDTLAVRMPSHKVARKLIELSGLPIAAPSANLSGKPSPTEGKHVVKDLAGRVNGIVIHEASEVGLESTILDLTLTPPMLLRPGGITVEAIEAVIGKIQVDPALEMKIEGHIKPKAPGMKYTHYSPDADVKVIVGGVDQMICKINEMYKSTDLKVGIMCTDESINAYPHENVLSLGRRSNLNEIASNLFKTLRQFDELGVDIVLAEGYDILGMGKAIMNRLNKAAGYQVIKV